VIPHRYLVAAVALSLLRLSAGADPVSSLTSEQQSWLAKAYNGAVGTAQKWERVPGRAHCR